MVEMIIRPAMPGDCGAIAHVHVEGWRTTYRGIVDQQYLDRLSPELRTEKWLENLAQPGHVTLVADDPAHGIVAFADGGPERTGRLDYRGELYAIYILESFRRQGLGTRLVSAIMTALAKAGIDSALIWVLADNPCRGFYEALGGRIIAEQDIDVGRQRLRECAYAWRPLPLLKVLE